MRTCLMLPHTLIVRADVFLLPYGKCAKKAIGICLRHSAIRALRPPLTHSEAHDVQTEGYETVQGERGPDPATHLAGANRLVVDLAHFSSEEGEKQTLRKRKSWSRGETSISCVLQLSHTMSCGPANGSEPKLDLRDIFMSRSSGWSLSFPTRRAFVAMPLKAAKTEPRRVRKRPYEVHE